MKRLFFLNAVVVLFLAYVMSASANARVSRCDEYLLLDELNMPLGQIPKPVFILDFEGGFGEALKDKSCGSGIQPSFPTDGQKPKVIKTEGIAGTDCIDFSARQIDRHIVSPVYTNPNLLNSLTQASSFTVSMWIREKQDRSSKQAVLITVPGLLTIERGSYDKLLFGIPGALKSAQLTIKQDDVLFDLSEIPDPKEKKRMLVGSTYPSGANALEQWLFIALTYDGTKPRDNIRFYIGSEYRRTVLEAYHTADGGPLAAKPKNLIIGADKPDGTGGADTMIDQVRIYTSKKDGSAALNLPQIEAVRQADLGNDWLTKVATEKGKQQMQEVQDQKNFWLGITKKQLLAYKVDTLDRIYPDMIPKKSEYTFPISTPRGAHVNLQFAVAGNGKRCTMKVSDIKQSDGTILKTTPKTFFVEHIPVESNNNGGIRTSPNTAYPPTWDKYIIREAPFEIAEPLIETDTMQTNMNRFKAALVDIDVPSDAKVGRYDGKVTFSLDGQNVSVDVPFSIFVHKTVISKTPKLNNVYWLQVTPECLTTEDTPKLWSDEHWQLLENSARILNEYGQNTISVGLIFDENNAIKTILKKDGSFKFDYSMFDKWLAMFQRLGFTKFEGPAIFGSHQTTAQRVSAFNEATGKKIQLFTRESDLEKWYEFTAIFLMDLYNHLEEKGWTEYYLQAVCDEPSDIPSYKRAYEHTKKYMPRVLTKEPCGSLQFSPFIDVQVFNIGLASEPNQQLAKKRRGKGKGVWLYHCCSPYPPYPNRHLDEPLANSRLYPWIAYMLNADGYLFWAANHFRGADPYKSSIGPLPGGKIHPGHPPGDNWFYYPGPEGLRSSMRMVAFRDGLIDYDLLDSLAKKDRSLADKIMNTIIRSITDYEADPVVYHSARALLLQALDKY